MDLAFIFYIFLCIVITSGGSFYYINSKQAITGGIFFFGFIAFSVVFGLRWFTASGERAGAATGGWPPVINYCPDFLSLYEVDGTQVCIDTIGIARQNGITQWNAGSTPPNSSQQFNLHLTDKEDVRVKALCDECAAKKVTWEGVYDGAICIGNRPPMPPRAGSA
jgi:hypothetical protein